MFAHHFSFGMIIALTGILAPVGAAGSPPTLNTNDEKTTNTFEILNSVGGSFNCVAAEGSHAYVGEGRHVTVFDVSVLESPRVVGRLRLDSAVTEIAAGAGLVAAVVNGDLTLVDVTDPAAPVRRGGLVTPGQAQEVAIKGNHAYVADGAAGLVIVDISNPDAPVQRAVSNTPGFAYGVCLEGGFAYVSDGDQGLRIIDVSSPGSPVVRGALDTPGSAKGAVVGNGIVFLDDGHLLAIDVANPSGPVIIDEESGAVHALALSGSALLSHHFLPFSNVRRTSLYDVSALRESRVLTNVGESPVTGTRWDAAASGFGFFLVGPEGLVVLGADYFRTTIQLGSFRKDSVSGRGLAVDGTRAYITDDRLNVLDVSDPSVPTLIGSLNLDPGKIVVEGSRAYIASLQGNLQIVDVSVPASPRLLGSLDLEATSVSGIAVEGTSVYVVTMSSQVPSRLQVVDVLDPANPAIIGSLEWNELTRDLEIAESKLYVADGSLRIIDVSDPTDPRTLTVFIPSLSSANSVEVVGPLAYIVGYPNLTILNVSNPANIIEMGSTETGGDDIGVSGSIACVSGYSGGVGFYDVSNPWSPAYLDGVSSTDTFTWNIKICAEDGRLYQLTVTIVPRTPTSTKLRILELPLIPPKAPSLSALTRLGVSGATAYLASSGSLGAASIASPALPQILPPFSVAADDLITSGSRLYTIGEGRVWAVETSGGTPTLLRSAPIAGAATGVTSDTARVYVTRSDGRIDILDVSDPTSFTLRGTAFTSGIPLDAAARGGFIYAAEGSDGIEIIDATSPDSPLPVGVIVGTATGVNIGGNILVRWNGPVFGLNDLEEPSAPARLGEGVAAGEVHDVSIAGTSMWVATGAGVQIFDISNPAAPVQAAILAGVGSSPDIEAVGVGSRAYAIVGDELLYLRGVGPDQPSVKAVLLGRETPVAEDDLNRDGVVDIPDLILAPEL